MDSKKYHRLSRLVGTTLIVTLILLSEIVFPQNFGKNKVQYRNFDWKFIQSKHFDIYYYGGARSLAEFTAEEAESSYVSLKKDFRYEIQKRIPILIYNSHNDFEQTNVTSYLLEESIGGFTEIFKDRVVVPFQGHYNEFRNVLHHELTHAVMFQMLYGGGVGSMLTTMARFQVPPWLAEGLAEYESLDWDTDSDMYMRDATLNGYVPPISQLYGFMSYKGGQSVLKYISEKYGGPKIGELLGKVRLNRSMEKGLKQSIGVGSEELTKRWHKYLRKTYWPDIENRDEPEDVGKRLTDHAKGRHFLNNAPALSPRGDKMVYLSNRSDYIDVCVMSTVDGKDLGRLVKGGRSDLFEELHWLRPGMGWSPDGKRVVLAAKAGAKDALYILDVQKKKIIDIHRFSLDGLFSPSWSPDGKQIAFMGMDRGQSDIYVFGLADGKLKKLTDDVFSDLDPTWSPDGNHIAFVSDRGDNTEFLLEDFRMELYDYSQYDLYTLDVRTAEITRHTSDEASEQSPAFSPEGDKIAFVSDKSGINNIYILDRMTKDIYPITNLLTGVSQISWSREGSRLAFASFYNGGYDIYLLNNPLEIEPGSIVLEKTAHLAKKEKEKKREEEKRFALGVQRQMEVAINRETQDYRNFIFGEEFKRGKARNAEKAESTFLDTSQYRDSRGEYKIHKYKIRFSPDIVSGAAGYSQFYGIQGTSMIALSDILGNHQINIYTDLFYSLKNSNFQFAYFYLPNRIDLGAAVFHYSYLFGTYFIDPNGFFRWGFIRDRNYGFTLYLSRPFNRYKRLNFGLTALGIDRDFLEYDWIAAYYGYGDIMKELGSIYKRRVLMASLGYTTDTVLWGMTGPVNGERSNIAVTYSPSISKRYGLDFWTVRGDLRKYLRIKRDYTFVVRLAGGVSGGKNPQRFLLGGMMNWINYRYNEDIGNVWGEEYIFFSSFETPLRGAPYYQMIGTRFVLTNLEFRFPLIRYLILGWPLPLGFQNIRGAMFMDAGSAWNNNKLWRPFSSDSFFHDIIAGYGFGLRLNMGFFLLKYDLAWSSISDKPDKKPIHYFTLGAEF